MVRSMFFAICHDILGPNEFRFKPRFTVFKQQCDDFFKVVIQFVESLALRMGAREAWYKSNI